MRHGPSAASPSSGSRRLVRRAVVMERRCVRAVAQGPVAAIGGGRDERQATMATRVVAIRCMVGSLVDGVVNAMGGVCARRAAARRRTFGKGEGRLPLRRPRRFPPPRRAGTLRGPRDDAARRGHDPVDPRGELRRDGARPPRVAPRRHSADARAGGDLRPCLLPARAPSARCRPSARRPARRGSPAETTTSCSTPSTSRRNGASFAACSSPAHPSPSRSRSSDSWPVRAAPRSIACSRDEEKRGTVRTPRPRHDLISASTSSRFASISGCERASRFSRRSGSVFDGRTLKCQSSASTEMPSRCETDPSAA